MSAPPVSEAAPSLQAAMRRARRGGASAQVLDDGEIAAGAGVTWEE